MSKFVIECPSCGKFAEAKTGFFARKKIDCACGYTINVRTDKLISRECTHCGNVVVFDQSKGSGAVCPVCHEPINTCYEQSKTVEFSCVQCGVRLVSNKSASTYCCPVCDYENVVAERVKNEEIKRDGLVSIIKYEGDAETFVWKHPIEDFNYGSQLIVHESQEAIFSRTVRRWICSERDGIRLKHSSFRCSKKYTASRPIRKGYSIPRFILSICPS